METRVDTYLNLAESNKYACVSGRLARGFRKLCMVRSALCFSVTRAAKVLDLLNVSLLFGSNQRVCVIPFPFCRGE